MSLSTISRTGEVRAYSNRGPAAQYHSVQFYESESFLVKSVASFIVTGIKKGEGVVIIATSPHLAAIRENISAQINLGEVLKTQQLLVLDAFATLSEFMMGSLPQEQKFSQVIGGVIDNMSNKFPVIRAYGEMVNILWEESNLEGTIALENLWNKLAETKKFSLLCGYSMENFNREVHGVAFKDVCGCHTHVHPTENYLGTNETDEARRLIAELQQRTLALQTEIAERASIEDELRTSRKDLLAAKEAAETASYTKSRFLANMSHEIRSPLTAILGFTELMKDANLTAKQRSDYLDIISRNGRQLSFLINDVLDLSKVESGKLDIELIPMSIEAVVKDVTSLYQQEALAKGVALKVEAYPLGFPARVCSDPTRVHQILTNLIGNAIKFTQAGEVKVSFEHGGNSEEGGHSIKIRIDDTGIGMSLAQQERIFQPFIQADVSTTRKYGGTGLGLALSKKLAEALAGDVNLFKTVEGKGSSFVFSFAANLATLSKIEQSTLQESIEVKPNPLQKRLEGIRILLAEDSVDNQDLICLYLSAEGASIDVAENGIEAVEKALRGDYHLILMDVMMPLCDGYEATRRLRRTGFSRPILALTAHALREERDRSFEAGCNDHLTKPMNWRLLVSSIERFVL